MVGQGRAVNNAHVTLEGIVDEKHYLYSQNAPHSNSLALKVVLEAFSRLCSLSTFFDSFAELVYGTMTGRVK